MTPTVVLINCGGALSKEGILPYEDVATQSAGVLHEVSLSYLLYQCDALQQAPHSLLSCISVSYSVLTG